METGFRIMSNHPRNNFYILRMVVDVQDYAVLLCRDVHQPAGQQNDRCSKRTGLPVKIDAYGVSEFDTQFPHYQVVLLGPQVKYMLKTLSDKAATQGIPVQPIDMMDYGMQRGDKVLDYALSLIEAAH